MRVRDVLAALSLAMTSAAWGQAHIDKTLALDHEGSNFDITAAPNGDLHMVYRTGPQGQVNANWHNINYAMYVKATDSWSKSVAVLEPQGVTDQQNVSADIDTNQPAIAF